MQLVVCAFCCCGRIHSTSISNWASERTVVAVPVCVRGCRRRLFIGHFLFQLLLVLPLQRISSNLGKVAAYGLTLVFLVALVTDTYVYQQYRFHINWPMIDLALVGGREVFSFSSGMMMKMCFLVACLALLAAALLWVSRRLSQRAKAVWCCLLIVLGYVAVNCVSAYSVSQNVKSVTVLAERVPLYFPIRANRF